VSAVARYMAAWVGGDPAGIAAAVTRDCVITECYGPVYRGRDWVLRWAQAWFAAGGVVHDWRVVDRMQAEDRETVEWIFTCTWQGTRSTFEGVTVARTAGGLLAQAREYRATDPLYDWQGTWRD